MTEELKQSAPRNHGPIQETDLYDFAGWLTTRPGVMSVGRSCEVGPLSEAVAEYIKAYPQRFALTAAQPAQAERDAFEAWTATQPHGKYPLRRDQEGQYRADGTEVAWDAWQARASLPTQPAAQATPEPVESKCRHCGVTTIEDEDGITMLGLPAPDRPIMFDPSADVPIPAPGVPDVEDLRDRLVAISAAQAKGGGNG